MILLIFIYLVAAAVLLLLAYVVFRVIVRREYEQKGRLSLYGSLLELLVWVLVIAFPYIYNPEDWPYFWLFHQEFHQLAGFILIVFGMILAFGTMIWFGLRRAFGLEVSGLVQSGPYGWSRNPQMMGGYLMVIGVALQWPSLYALGWCLLYGLVGYWMILSEEEHLERVFGEAYRRYASMVKRLIPGVW